MINVGIVGLGHVAKHQVAALQQLDQLRLVAGCDSDPDNLEMLEADVAAYTDLQRMLEHAGLDVVVVATPNRLHVEHGTEVLQAGKWLVVEKPVAETQLQFVRLLDARAKLGGRCTVALHAAYGVEVDWFCSRVLAGQFDEYRFDTISSQFFDLYIERGSLRNEASSLGGAWMDSGINALSVLGRIVRPECITITDSHMQRDKNIACLEVSGRVEFELSDALITGSGSIETNWTLGVNKKTTVLGIANSNRSLLLDHSEQLVRLCDPANEKILFSCQNGQSRLTNHYIGVFTDLVQQFQSAQDNLEYAQQLHTLVYQAEEWCD